MSLTNTPSSERLHIGFFGLRNAGKSSLVNAVTGQSVSVVSDILGTTTDPVKKSMELLPLGPVTIIDTPGLDDEGVLGEMRIKKAREILATCDIAVIVTEAGRQLTTLESELLQELKLRKIPFLVVKSKLDLLEAKPRLFGDEILVSSKTGEGVTELKNALAKLKPQSNEKQILSDLLSPNSLVVLVTPIDAAAPRGRLILPQQQTLRELLDNHHTTLVCQVEELSKIVENYGRDISLVVTDSQAFAAVGKIVPEEIPLTSFSILFARYKGDLEALIGGIGVLSEIRDGDKILISEGCTHHRQCGDIGTVKIPAMLKKISSATPKIEFTSGGEFPQDLSRFRLVIHCGGCMLTEKEMAHRQSLCREAGVPMVNYGVALSHMNGLLSRSLRPLMKTK